MPFAPRHNWGAYNAAVNDYLARRHLAGSDSSISPNLEAAFVRYASYFDSLQTSRRGLRETSSGDPKCETQTRWEEKIAMRRRLLTIYEAMDVACDG